MFCSLPLPTNLSSLGRRRTSFEERSQEKNLFLRFISVLCINGERVCLNIRIDDVFQRIIFVYLNFGEVLIRLFIKQIDTNRVVLEG